MRTTRRSSHPRPSPLRLAATALALAALAACERGERTPAAPADPEPAAERATGTAAEAEAEAASSAEDVCVEGLVVAWEGALDAPAGVERTQDEAKARADALMMRLERDGERFESLVATESDLWDEEAGYVGTFPADRWPSELTLLKGELLSVSPGMITPVVETAYGWVIGRRCRVARAVFRQILVAWKGAEGAADDVAEDEEGAQRRAQALHAMAVASPHGFGDLARAHSDDAATKADGGRLGELTRGRLPAPLDEVGFSLPELGVSPVYRTPRGYVFYQRLPVDYDPAAHAAPPPPPPPSPGDGEGATEASGGDVAAPAKAAPRGGR